MSGYLRRLNGEWGRCASVNNKSLAREMIESHGKDIEFLHVGVDSSKTPSGIRFLHDQQLYAVFGIGDKYNADGSKIANIPLSDVGLKRLIMEVKSLPPGFPEREAVAEHFIVQIKRALTSLDVNAKVLQTFNPRPQGQTLKRA